MLKNRNLINADDLNVEEINETLNLAKEIIKSPSDFSNLCNGKILGTLFSKPSTRARLSFESAIHRLGGDCIGFSESASSSTSEGKSLVDAIRTVSGYTDIIAMRDPKEGSTVLASSYAEVPLINAEGGGHQHPTQILTDLLTIWMAKKKLDSMTIRLCGDLKLGRTVHSLIKAMSRYENNKFILISPEGLQISDYIKMFLKSKNIESKGIEKMEDVIGELDVLYTTRVQKERFSNKADYVRLKDSYILDNDKMKLATEDLAVLHPLPRVNEIITEVDGDPRAVYFKQVRYGIIVRMALTLKLLGVR